MLPAPDAGAVYKPKKKRVTTNANINASGSFPHPGDAGYRDEYSTASHIANLMHAVAGSIASTKAHDTTSSSSSHPQTGGGAGGGIGGGIGGGGSGASMDSGPSDASLRAQAIAMVAAQLDPQLKLIGGQEKQTNTRYHSNDAAIQSLYRGLAANFNQEAGARGKDYSNALTQSDNNYKSLQGSLQGDRSDALHDTLNELSRLGLGAVGSAATSGMSRDGALLEGLAKTQGAQSHSALDQLKHAAVTYMQDMAGGATTQGALRHDDLTSQLTQALQGFSAQRQGIEAQRGGAIQDTLGKLQQQRAANQQAQAAAQQAQAEFALKAYDTRHDNALGDASLQANTANQAATQAYNAARLKQSAISGASSQSAPTNGVDAALYALTKQNGLDAGTAQALQNIMNRTLSGSKDIATGSNAWESDVKTHKKAPQDYKTPEQKAMRVLEDFDSSGFAHRSDSNKLREALRKATLAYFGSGW